MSIYSPTHVLKNRELGQVTVIAHCFHFLKEAAKQPRPEDINFLEVKGEKIQISQQGLEALKDLQYQLEQLQAFVDELNVPLTDHTTGPDRSVYSYVPFVPVMEKGKMRSIAQKIVDDVNAQLQQAIRDAGSVTTHVA